MNYQQKLLEQAAKQAGSWYRLAKAINVATQNLSAVKNGRRDMPLTWVYDVAVIAGVEPGEALARVRTEQRLQKALTPPKARGVNLPLPLWRAGEAVVSI